MSPELAVEAAWKFDLEMGRPRVPGWSSVRAAYPLEMSQACAQLPELRDHDWRKALLHITYPGGLRIRRHAHGHAPFAPPSFAFASAFAFAIASIFAFTYTFAAVLVGCSGAAR